ncbi:MAG: sigma-54-dependent Fis family transcriptional regulator [Paludibacteraceae bacterium]|nr:sigma-54-dependent Fis family transcriptional regulator [Paludibacteraceae bacterium]MBO7635909.1 sigma-54-dependent Fis family transcriptional regulator [Paludibacteraceae bacterium]MBR5971151.1 sigma-54-dependent Fis family transcriptional regulator [Paludibacteraceae bacterium]
MVNKDLQSVKQRFGIIGSDTILDHAINVAVQVASTDLSVLITGESGVGKERFPQIIHEYSARKHFPCIAVNCGAIPEGTIDSELFGHEKGSFTGAISDRKGYFEVADKGTIFLDEVGELPLTTQVRLLRVLETGEFIKVGSSKVQKCDVRVVAATNLDIPKAIAEGRFREDLYYRLNSVPISVPPLRNRGTDIYLLFRKFAVDFAEKYQMPPISLTDEARQLLLHYPWPGNVRQLKNITEQISVLETKREITKDVLLNYLPNQRANNLPALSSLSSSDKSFSNEREILYQVLFDMKKDMNDLKKLVNDIIQSGNVDTSHLSVSDIQTMQTVFPESYTQPSPSVVSSPTTINTGVTSGGSSSKIKDQRDIQDMEEYVEENLSLDEVEKEMIRKALERNNNKRKYAAQDLNISERTLYRKIKEYGLE